MRNLYPFQGRYLTVNGLDYHYIDEGAGDPIVMLHGNPTWSFYYRNLIALLSPNNRTIAPDHIGCGFSAKPDDRHYDYTLERRVSDLTDFLDQLRIDRNITLVLHDWGGMIGMAYAVRYPERIRRLIIMNTSAFLLPTTKSFPAALAFARSSLGKFLILGMNAFARGASYVCCTRNPMSRDVRAMYLLPYNSWKNRIATLRFVQDIPLKPGDRAYSLVSSVSAGIDQFRDTPMIVFWGGRDFVFDRHFYDEWHNRFPNAEFHYFADAGHYILEDAWEPISDLIPEFIRRHPISHD